VFATSGIQMFKDPKFIWCSLIALISAANVGEDDERRSRKGGDVKVANPNPSYGSTLFGAATAVNASNPSYGSTLFGYWTEDNYLNPAFVFTGGNSSLPFAVYPKHSTVIHSVGNDRVSAIIFSDGSASLRQDEGGAKLLHGSFFTDSLSYQFRGAAGYSSNSTHVLSASVIDTSCGIEGGTPLQVTLGMGYATKTSPVLGGGIANHTILSPFGDDSVTMSLVSLSPLTSSVTTWTEAWASGSRWEMGWGSDNFTSHNATAFQRAWAHKFDVVYDPVSGTPIGLVDAASIVGAPSLARGVPSLHDPSPRPSFIVCLSCMSFYNSSRTSLLSYSTRGAQVFCKNGSSCNDASPGAPLNRGADALLYGLDNSTEDFRASSIMSLQVSIPSSALGHQQGAQSLDTPLFSVAFLVGYLSAEDEDSAPGGNCTGSTNVAACVIRKAEYWAPLVLNEFYRTSTAWALSANDIEFGIGAAANATTLGQRARVAQHPAVSAQSFDALQHHRRRRRRGESQPLSWEGREASWHSYMLRSSLTFDDYAGAHTINQGGNYLFVSGQNAAARDPLAHVMPLAWGGRSSEIFVGQVLNATLFHQKRTSSDAMGRPAGSIIWGLAAFGMTSAASFNASDLELAALFTLSQFVLATRNSTAILEPLWDAAWDSFQHLDKVIGVGEHGLIRLLLSDHNDGLYSAFGVQPTAETMDRAESVMNSALAAYVLPQYADALEIAGGVNASARSTAVRAKAAALSAAVAAQFVANGTSNSSSGWYCRAWLGGANINESWRGSPDTDGTMWTETQSWALLSNVPTLVPNRAEALVDQISRTARDPSPIGAINTVPDTTVDGGVGYGGVWNCGILALITALGMRGWPDLALNEWRKSSLANHAEVYPFIWFGATSGSDVYNSVYASRHNATPGSTRCHWNDPRQSEPCEELLFPVLNLWSHTLGTYTLPSLIGAEWTYSGLIIRPPAYASSADEEYTIFTPLVSASRAAGNESNCELAGHWAPNLEEGTVVHLEVHLALADLRCSLVSVNGGDFQKANINDGVVTIDAPLYGDPPVLTWALL